MSKIAFSPTERRATLGLAAIYALRLLGTFLVLPALSLYAPQLQDATPTLIGIAMGAYGLTQALLQIPFGTWSDRIGRKPVIAVGLFLLSIGSLISGSAHSIFGLIAGRSIQGLGAIGSATMALVADSTRAEQRTRAMAIIGMTIGFSFTLAMLLGPILSGHFNVPALFVLIAIFGMISIAILYFVVPKPDNVAPAQPTTSKQFWRECLTLLKDRNLINLNIGIFILHAIFIASFIVIPISLQNSTGLTLENQWKAYLPSLVIASLLVMPLLRIAQRGNHTHQLFLLAISLMIAAQFAGLLLFQTWIGSVCQLLMFFLAFTVLEAQLPTFISLCAPTNLRGTALGMYSTCQFLGIFCGGMGGGWLLGHYSNQGIFIACGISAMLWLALALKQPSPLKQQNH